MTLRPGTVTVTVWPSFGNVIRFMDVVLSEHRGAWYDFSSQMWHVMPARKTSTPNEFVLFDPEDSEAQL